ncbi:hypothetical protein INT47_010250, partial [Mucor saturninus]
AILAQYQILINGHPCKVLIDSGASANYVHSDMLPFVSTIIPTKRGQSVETANGQQTYINQIAVFSIALNGYTDRIQAYVFDTKFDVILGRSWLSQVQPIPDWFHGTWKIRIRNNPTQTTMIYPLPEHLINKSSVLPKVIPINSIEANMNTNPDMNQHNLEDLDFLLSAKQLDQLFKKKKVEECYLIDVSSIYQDSDELLVLVDDKLPLSKQTNNEIIENSDKEWCCGDPPTVVINHTIKQY